MKIKIKGLTIDSNALIRVQWKFPLPKIYLHEKFEGIAKWVARIIVGSGIAVSFLALPTMLDVTVAILLLGLEVMIEKIVFEYSCNREITMHNLRQIRMHRIWEP